jgi:hypothetical protein
MKHGMVSGLSATNDVTGIKAGCPLDRDKRKKLKIFVSGIHLQANLKI